MVYLLRQIVFDDGSLSLIIRKQFKTHKMSRLAKKNNPCPQRKKHHNTANAITLSVTINWILVFKFMPGLANVNFVCLLNNALRHSHEHSL